MPNPPKYEWNPKWNKDPNYNCTTCKWLGQSQGGIHWGCYFKGRYQRWLRQALARRKTVCTIQQERNAFRDSDVHWDPVEGFKLKPPKQSMENSVQAILGNTMPIFKEPLGG